MLLSTFARALRNIVAIKTGFHPTAGGTFVPMVKHVGKSLEEFFLATGLKKDKLLTVLPFTESTMNRHFRNEDLSTGVLRDYETAYAKLGIRMSAGKLLDGVGQEPALNVVAEPTVVYRKPDNISDAAVLLRQAAELLEGGRSSEPTPSEQDRGE